MYIAAAVTLAIMGICLYSLCVVAGKTERRIEEYKAADSGDDPDK